MSHRVAMRAVAAIHDRDRGNRAARESPSSAPALSLTMLRRLPLLLSTLAACAPPPGPPAGVFTADVIAPLLESDLELDACRGRLAEIRSEPAVTGAPDLDAVRPAMLGRALGEPVVFRAAPAGEREVRTMAGVQRLVRSHRHDEAGLRAAVLRDGYLYSEDPIEAFALVRELTLTDLFAEERIFLLRGETLHTLERQKARYDRGFAYVHVDGPEKGREAKILMFDRVGSDEAAVKNDTLHRDLRSFRNRVGFDRMRIEHHTQNALVASLRFDGRWVTALVDAQGPHLELACLDAAADERAAIEAFVAEDAPRRRAVASLQTTVGQMVAERMPFDRPRKAEDHLSDGQLRPQWEWAYRRGSFDFSYEEQGYAVFDRDGMPHPPQTCVELILDTYERASGTWYRPQGQPAEKVIGGIDFAAIGVVNRSGVLAFEKFAEEQDELFVHQRFPERIAFRDRDAFFQNLVEKADWFAPGDVVAIQGPKPDGYVHQHAILIEDVDPMTGMPYALFDQMKRPRQRTWEMIMAEAPLRALLYHVRPRRELFLRLDPQRRDDGTKMARAD